MGYPDQQARETSPPDVFDARAFLRDFRLTMVQTDQVFNGPVKAGHKEELEPYLLDAELVAEAQVERTKKLLPEGTPGVFLDLAEPYVQGFTRLVRGLGVSALRLADKGDTRFVTALRDSSSRQKVLRSLATDFRSIVWRLEDESTEDFNPNTLRNYVPLYQPASTVKELQERFPDFSPADLKAAVLGRPKNPKGFMEFAVAKIQELSDDPTYGEMPPSSIKHAVIAHTSAPEAYLDKVIATIEELAANPRYADFGIRAIRYVVAHYTRTSPKVALERVITKSERMLRNRRYASLPPALVKHTVLMSPESAEIALDTAVATIASLTANPRYDIFGVGDITQAVLFHPRDAASFLETVRQRYDTFRADPRYAGISDGYIRGVVLNHTKKPQEFLDFAVLKIEELLAHPRYRDFGVGYITDAVFGRPENPETYLDKILARIEAFEADPAFAILERKTIRYAVMYQSKEADKVLRRIAADKARGVSG